MHTHIFKFELKSNELLNIQHSQNPLELFQFQTATMLHTHTYIIYTTIYQYNEYVWSGNENLFHMLYICTFCTL